MRWCGERGQFIVGDELENREGWAKHAPTWKESGDNPVFARNLRLPAVTYRRHRGPSPHAPAQYHHMFTSAHPILFNTYPLIFPFMAFLRLVCHGFKSGVILPLSSLLRDPRIPLFHPASSSSTYLATVGSQGHGGWIRP